MGTVLIVDDDLVSRTLASHIVKSLGLEVVEAISGSAGLAVFENTDVDLVLCDYEMPGMKGLELLDEVRTVSAVPFVLLTGYGEREEFLSYPQQPDGYLTKPFSSRELRELIAEVLGAKSAH